MDQRFHRKCVLLGLALLTILSFPTAAVEAADQQAQQRGLRRSWTCHATIFLSGTNHQYTLNSWTMSRGGADRQKACQNHIYANLLRPGNPAIWKHFDLSAEEQNRICRAGKGTFRVVYGFDERDKAWNFEQQHLAPPCDCATSCPNGYDLDDRSSPRNPRCVRLLCPGAAAGIPDERFGAHDKGIGIWGGNVYHHQPVVRGACCFAGSPACESGTWTPWLDRDNPSGSGDFEALAAFRESGQVCANPKQIQCRLRGSTQLVQTGLVNGREQYVCDLASGGVCDNRRQSPGVQCSDYEVRFLCP